MEVHRMGPQREELRQEEERVQLRREELRLMGVAAAPSSLKVET